jgi:MFS family permease
LAGFLGVIAGGRIADHLRKTNPAGRILVVLLAPLVSIVPFVIAFTTDSATIFYAAHFCAAIFTSAALGGTAATTQDLVLPRMRGVATATFFLATTLVGLSLGPYMAGQVSSVTGNLATGILSVMAVAPISAILLILAYRSLPVAEASLVARARDAGEPI